MPAKQAWERVLAAIETDARRAEALLRDELPEPDADPDEPDGSAETFGIPGNWLLPAAADPSGQHALRAEHTGSARPLAFTTHAPEPQLPALDQMPPVPPELRERIDMLRAQIARLQDELASAMSEWQAPQRSMPIPTPERPPVYVDRRL